MEDLLYFVELIYWTTETDHEHGSIMNRHAIEVFPVFLRMQSFKFICEELAYAERLAYSRM
jgi:hypothetical protein